MVLEKVSGDSARLGRAALLFAAQANRWRCPSWLRAGMALGRELAWAPERLQGCAASTQRRTAGSRMAWPGQLLRSTASTMGLLCFTWGDLIGERFGRLIIKSAIQGMAG